MVAIFLLTTLISYTDRLVLSVLVDEIRGELRLSDSYVGFLQGPAFTLVYVFAAVAFGRLTDRRQRKPILITGVVLWCLAQILCGLAPNGSVLLVGRLLLGIGEGVLLPATFSMIADCFPAERLGLANGVVVLGTVVGGPLGITVGGVLLSAAKGGTFAGWPVIASLAPWRFVLVAMGIAGFMSPLLLLTIREPSRALTSGADAQGAMVYFRSEASRLWPLYGAMALLSIGDYGLVSWIPTTLSRHFGWAADAVGVTFGIVTATTGVAGALCGGWISDFAERRSGAPGRLAVSSMATIFAVMAAAVICLGSANLVVVGLGLWVLASTVGAVGAFCVLQEMMPAQVRGTGVALLTFSNTLIGLGCGPTLVALTTDHVYRVATAVDRSISTVAVPAGTLACTLLLLARYRMKHAHSPTLDAATPSHTLGGAKLR
jgi:MFS family permease